MDCAAFFNAARLLKKEKNLVLKIPKLWKAERDKLTAKRKQLDRDYHILKDEVKETEQIRRSVYSILRQEQRKQQPRRAQDMER